VYVLAKDKPCAVQALEFDRMTSTPGGDLRYFILATLPGRLYQFVGTTQTPSSSDPSLFSRVFATYDGVPDRFLELPGSIVSSQLQVYYSSPSINSSKGNPRSFAWMTGSGFYCGRIDLSAPDGRDVTVDTKLLNYRREDFEMTPAIPVSFSLTEFHLLIMFADRVKGLCIVNDRVVFSDEFKDQPLRTYPLLGMFRYVYPPF